MANEVAVRTKQEVYQKLTNNLDASLVAVHDCLPGDFNKARFLQNTMAVVKANSSLLQYSASELLTCSMQAAYLGLDFMNKEAWLVPYNNHVTFQLGYKGACKFIKKYSIRPIQDIYAKAVRAGDDFYYGDNAGEQFLTWKPIPFNNADIIGVYACIQFKDGGVLYEVMSKEEVDKIRNRSKAGRSGPWVTDYEEMAKKTVLKRISKNVETDFDNTEQRTAWEADNDEFKTEQISADVIDVMAEEVKEEVIEADVVEIPTDVPDVEGFK